MSTSTRYYWLTVDLGVSASGTITGTIGNASGIIVLDDGVGSASKYGPLNVEPYVPLPVSMTSFNARSEGSSIILEWSTECEINNLGFILQRSQDESGIWQIIASYRTHDALKGQGNKSNRTEYHFIDINIEGCKGYYYRLSDVSFESELTIHPPIFIHLDELPKETVLEMAYPNPFNPQTYIAYDLAETSDMKISVFDILGHLVKVLYNGHQFAGSYHVYWNGTDENDTKVPSGTYIILLQTENTKQIQKIILMK